MSETKLIDIKELKFDEHNFNRHNDEGMSLLEKSIKENGLGRSILLDKDNNIVGGNGVTEKAIELGKTKVRIIETGGGLHGKSFCKADVSVNIYAFLKAQETGRPVEISCAIGDETVDGKPYSEIVEIARKYIHDIGGFEKFAEWGLIR